MVLRVAPTVVSTLPVLLFFLYDAVLRTKCVVNTCFIMNGLCINILDEECESRASEATTTARSLPDWLFNRLGS